AVALFPGIFITDLRVLVRMRKRIGQEREQARGADVVERGSHQDGKDFFSDNGFAHGGNQIVDGNGTLSEEFLHHRVVAFGDHFRSEEHTSELQSRFDLVCRLLLEKKKKTNKIQVT